MAHPVGYLYVYQYGHKNIQLYTHSPAQALQSLKPGGITYFAIAPATMTQKHTPVS